MVLVALGTARFWSSASQPPEGLALLLCNMPIAKQSKKLWACACVIASVALLLRPRNDDRLGLFGGEELADGIWYFPKLISDEAIEAVLGNLPPEGEWRECPDSWGGRKCSKLEIGSNPHLQSIASTLGALWGLDSAVVTVTHVPLMSFSPGHDGVGLHTDVHKLARETKDNVTEDTIPADLTLLVYVTDSDPSHGGQTVFASRNLSVSPSRGALLAWTNINKQGETNFGNAHYVSPYAKYAPSERVVMQFSLSLRAHDSTCPGKSSPWMRGLAFHPLKGGVDSDRLLCGEHLGYTTIEVLQGEWVKSSVKCEVHEDCTGRGFGNGEREAGCLLMEGVAEGEALPQSENPECPTAKEADDVGRMRKTLFGVEPGAAPKKSSEQAPPPPPEGPQCSCNKWEAASNVEADGL